MVELTIQSTLPRAILVRGAVPTAPFFASLVNVKPPRRLHVTHVASLGGDIFLLTVSDRDLPTAGNLRVEPDR